MKVKFFSHLKLVAGCSEMAFSPAGNLDADQLWELLERKIPGIARYKSSTRLARNFVYVGPETTFGDGDEIALIPPVSGG